ncbi:periodic tryptophan protein 2 homolog [Littorina saxatilis]|uniref:Small-subunit processome Utp12 domain-containing protein n=1 Tax=Littorina saxatilis TaxID=31220 RepID=A0AAN9B3E0_9CAEN
MKFSYKFSNLLGAVYRKGNLEFLPDGFKVASPVGNRVSIFDLKNSKSETLPIEGHLNFTSIAVSPDGCLMILVNEEGEALLCSLVSRSVVGTYHFHNKVHCVKFSPDGKKFAVTRDTVVLVFHAPGMSRVYNPFLLYRTFTGAFDETTCIDWSSDSKVFVVGSEDKEARVFAVEPCVNLVIHSLGGHTDAVVGAFFEHNSMDVYSANRRGHLCVWKCNQNTTDLVTKADKKKMDARKEREKEKRKEERGASEEESEAEEENEEDGTDGIFKVRYKKAGRHILRGAKGTEDTVSPELTSCDFHKPSHILVSGFSNGTFMIHEMPDFNLIHSLSIADESSVHRAITSVTFNNFGDLIAIGCADLGQLLVWEWQSQQQALKQQSHANKMACIAYSPNGQNLVTGGDDGKVKVWDTSSGFSFVTFDQHSGGVTGVTFFQSGKAIMSSSQDGTVRAFDLTRYRNFKTFTAPRHVQFSCVAVDPSGSIVCAGCQDVFEIYVWNIKTSKLLEILADHEGPVSCLAFSQGTTATMLASASWDKTVKLWEIFDSRGAKETLKQEAEVLTLAFRPDGKELAVGTLSAKISFWDPVNGRQTGCVEGRHDLDYGRKETDKVTGKTLAAGKAFTTLCYSADGKVILAGGQSKNVCIYSVTHQLLMKKFQISQNHSLDGMEEFLDKRQMTEWGNKNLVEEGQGSKLTLPGVKEGNFSARHFKPEVKVMQVQFSPTGREWVAATTEGLMVYSLDQRVIFDPYDLEMDITPAQVRAVLTSGDYAKSLIMALRLNEEEVTQEVLESTPVDYVETIGGELSERYVDRLLSHVVDAVGKTSHLQYYVRWVHTLLQQHGPSLKARAQSLMGVWRTLEKNLSRRRDELAKVVDHNTYSLHYLVDQFRLKDRQRKERKRKNVTDSGNESDVGSHDDSSSADELDKVVAMGMDSESDEEISQLF